MSLTILKEFLRSLYIGLVENGKYRFEFDTNWCDFVI